MAMAQKSTDTHTPVCADSPDTELDPCVVREKAGLGIEDMARIMAMSEFGYTAWENGTRRPGGPAYQLLRLLDDDPKTVAAALMP